MSDTPQIAGGDPGDLPPASRAAHYRDLADRHLSLAGVTAAADARAAHLELAALWTRLAGEADRQAKAPILDTQETRPLGAGREDAEERSKL